jgi:Zn-dependent protease with chaperone function
MKNFLLLIVFIGAIPVGGYIAGTYVELDLQNQWAEFIIKEFGSNGLEAIKTGQLSIERFCAEPDAAGSSLCQTYSYVRLLKSTSVVVLMAGLGLLFTIFLGVRIASSSRSLLFNLFSPGIKIVLLGLFALTLAQGAIATYGAYILEASIVHRVHFYLIGGIGLGALFGAFTMIKAGFSVSRRASTTVLGKVISESSAPELWKFVREIAARLGATPPNNIVMGLEPNFYVTSADVVVYPGAHKQPNETLYLSLPLMRILSRNELSAIIGHELGHFMGEDTKFSLRFYPIYAGTRQALVALSSQGKDGPGKLALLPALAILSFFMEQFAKAERTIGRNRELEADKVGASVSSAKSLSTSLLKIGAFAPFWNSIVCLMVEALNTGKSYTNVCSLYAEVAASSNKQDLLNGVATMAMVHPTDTHPPTGARIQALGLTVEEIREESLNIDLDASSANLLANPTEIEEELTEIEQRMLLEIGAASLPETPQQ